MQKLSDEWINKLLNKLFWEKILRPDLQFQQFEIAEPYQILNHPGFCKLPVYQVKGKKDDNIRRILNYLDTIDGELSEDQKKRIVLLLSADDTDKFILNLRLANKLAGPNALTATLKEFHTLLINHYDKVKYDICAYCFDQNQNGEKMYRLGGISRFHYVKVSEVHRQPESPDVFKYWGGKDHPVRLSSPKYLEYYSQQAGYTFYATLPFYKNLYVKANELQICSLTLGIDVDVEKEKVVDQYTIDTLTELINTIVTKELFFVKNSINCHTSGRGAYILIHHKLLSNPSWTNEDYQKFMNAFNCFIKKKLRSLYEIKGAIKIDAINDRNRIFKVPFTIHQKQSVSRITVPFRPGEKIVIEKTEVKNFNYSEWEKPYQKYDTNETSALLDFLEEWNKIETLINIIKTLIEKGNLADINDIINLSMEEGITLVEVNKFIDLLLQIGEIYKRKQEKYGLKESSLPKEKIARKTGSGHFAQLKLPKIKDKSYQPIYPYVQIFYRTGENLDVTEPNDNKIKTKRVLHSGVEPLILNTNFSKQDSDTIIIKTVRELRTKFKTYPYIYFWWGINSRVVIDQREKGTLRRIVDKLTFWIKYPPQPIKSEFQYLILKWSIADLTNKEDEEALLNKIYQKLELLREKDYIGQEVDPMIIRTTVKEIIEYYAVFISPYTENEIDEVFTILEKEIDSEWVNQWKKARNLYLRISPRVFGRATPLTILQPGKTISEFKDIHQFIIKYIDQNSTLTAQMINENIIKAE